MAESAETILKDALRLSEEDRVRVASELLASVEFDVETRDSDAWIAEIERRAQSALGGSPALTWDEARERVEERLRRK